MKRWEGLGYEVAGNKPEDIVPREPPSALFSNLLFFLFIYFIIFFHHLELIPEGMQYIKKTIIYILTVCCASLFPGFIVIKTL